ncbi:RNA pyrophosphohydrolase [Yunchengibacter salinarum]|uniref:RNA pyrophosphohydrolase n=1 Tax=Yunchengibacter salinarum TaxID=3133399 RepID=UPI0035B6761A
MPPDTSPDRASLPYRPCVGLMLLNDRGHIFVGERIDTPGAWQMPQGGIDPGEDVTTAGLRELEEEIGLTPSDVTIEGQTDDWVLYDLPDHLLGKVWGGKYRGQKQHWLKLRLTAPDSRINLDTAHPEFTRWKWSTPEQVLDEIVPFKRDMYERVLRTLVDQP